MHLLHVCFGFPFLDLSANFGGKILQVCLVLDLFGLNVCGPSSPVVCFAQFTVGFLDSLYLRKGQDFKSVAYAGTRLTAGGWT